MKEFIEKLISRLEERRNEENNNSLCEMNENGHTLDFECSVGKTNAFNESISIVNELAEEYQSRIMIDNEYCWQKCGAVEHCKECNRLGNGITDYFENYDSLVEEYSADTPQKFANGWIPCSEKLPEGDDDTMVLYTDKDGEVDTCCLDWFLSYSDEMYAWQPLPQPYKPQQESEWKDAMMKHFTKVE